MRPAIKRGVSLYSYQEEYFLRKMTLEDCIAAAAAAGATGIEVVGEQMFPGFPRLSEAFLEQWFGWMEQYGVEPVAHDMMLDLEPYKGRYLTLDEQLASVLRDLHFARQLGCKVVRVIVNASPELMERAIPYAEEMDIKLGIEVHSPWHLHSAWMTRHLEVMEKTGTKHFGFIPDGGAFTRRLPRVAVERLIREGADEKIAAFVCEQHEKGVLAEYIIAEVEQMSNRPIDRALAMMTRHNVFSNPQSIEQFEGRIVHVHGKCYEMLEDSLDGRPYEYSIPYDEIVAALKNIGFDGYICTEYEGNRHIQDIMEVNSVEQVRRHQRMLEQLIG